MKLSDIESKQLLPRFASKFAWMMDALDSLIKTTAYRAKSIDAPLTLDSIHACTDEELEALYNQYGVAKYYPDLSRDTRDKMLYEMARIYRYLGTPKAIKTLCEYIFDSIQLNVSVIDNLAFDEDGELVDESLLDVFDIEVEPSVPILDKNTNERILANIIRFSRNSQALRDILYEFEQNYIVSVSPCQRFDNPQVTQSWPQDNLCVLPPLDFVVVDDDGKILTGAMITSEINDLQNIDFQQNVSTTTTLQVVEISQPYLVIIDA